MSPLPVRRCMRCELVKECIDGVAYSWADLEHFVRVGGEGSWQRFLGISQGPYGPPSRSILIPS